MKSITVLHCKSLVKHSTIMGWPSMGEGVILSFVLPTGDPAAPSQSVAL